MKKVLLYIFTGAALMFTGNRAAAGAPMPVRFHNEANDTTKITRMLIDAYASDAPIGKKTVALAEAFENCPYAAGTLEGTPEQLTVDINEFDCTTFVETVAAMALTLSESRTSWLDFVYNLQQLRYRDGDIKGYASRLHYFSDWVIDNTHRGHLKEVTDRIGPASYAIKTLDFMSSNASKYPALADSASLAGIKNTEIGYRMHRIPYIKTANIDRAKLRDGDIVAITTTLKNLDVSHEGIVKIIDGKPHLIHASSKAGKVIVDPLTLQEYVRRNRQATGIRVVRLSE